MEAVRTSHRKTTNRASRELGPSAAELEVLRKPVNTLAIVPKSARITSLGRKAYNVLLFEAQEQGLDKDVFRAPLERVMRGVAFDSNDHALIKKHLRSMVSTTVEWQSPTTGEGPSWNVSGLLAHAKLSKERGQVWVEWSYAVNLKQELLAPTVFAKLKLEIISQLRSHAGIALYEICARYRDVGRTSRQPWRWWRPVLSGQPDTEKTAHLEYRIFKRDTLKPAIAEVSAIADLEVELVEHKAGRFIAEIQFAIRPKRQPALPFAAPQSVDLAVVAKAVKLGIDDEKAEELIQLHGEAAVVGGLEALDKRIAAAFPSPLRNPYRYLLSIMPGEAAKAEQLVAHEKAQKTEKAVPTSELLSKRQARWTEEWIRRRREKVAGEIGAMSEFEQAELVAALLLDMERRSVHPSIQKRLHTGGWQHPMVIDEMVRFFATGAHGEHWDQPTSEQLLEIAAELGNG